MSGLSPAGQAVVLASLTGTFFVSLHSSDPGDTGANELAVGTYARQGPVAFSNSGSNPTVSANSAIVPFGTAGVDWGSVSFFGAWDNIIGGNFRGSGPLDIARVVYAGDTVRFLIGALKLSANR
jgi:hypothetical protein